MYFLLKIFVLCGGESRWNPVYLDKCDFKHALKACKMSNQEKMPKTVNERVKKYRLSLSEEKKPL